MDNQSTRKLLLDKINHYLVIDQFDDARAAINSTNLLSPNEKKNYNKTVNSWQATHESFIDINEVF
jgi:hypothetical protein